jgi:chromosome segregation ATPase
MKAHYQHLEVEKQDLDAEVSRLREAAKEEAKKADRMEQTYVRVDASLKDLRAEMAHWDGKYREMQMLSSEEEVRSRGVLLFVFPSLNLQLGGYPIYRSCFYCYLSFPISIL